MNKEPTCQNCGREIPEEVPQEWICDECKETLREHWPSTEE